MEGSVLVSRGASNPVSVKAQIEARVAAGGFRPIYEAHTTAWLTQVYTSVFG